MKTKLTLFLCLFISSVLFAQKAPIKWGKIDAADLGAKSYDLDPEAEAMVLADYGNLNFDLSTGDILFLMEHHVRIKIFKQTAFDRGDISIPYYSFNNQEKISGLKAQIILPNGEKINVSKKDFFDEKINKYWSYRKFAFPALEEGCIIEYKYTKKSDQIYYLEDWYFQSDIPTRLSEFRTNIPEWFNYVVFDQGLSPESEKTQQSKSLSVPRQRVVTNRNALGTRGSQMTGGKISAVVIKTRYYLENVPALKRENFITTMQDYYSKISLQLQSVKYPNSPTENVTTTWPRVARELEESSIFGSQVNRKKNTKKLFDAVSPSLANAKDDMEKVAAIYSFLSNNIAWNKLYGFTSTSLDNAFEKNAATRGELNLMFIALCRKSNIKAFPVLVSTRDNGRPMQYYPKTDQFNHVISFVEVGDKQFLFDVGSPNRDPNLLRLNSLNYKGWLVDGANSQWISLPSPTDNRTTMATLDLDENGTLSGKINQRFIGYCALDERSDFFKNKKENHKHVKEEWQECFPDIAIENITFENESKVNESLKCGLEISIPQAAQVSDDFIYLSPMLGLGYNENPLKQEERTFPVDLHVKSNEQYILNLTIPEGYAIEELPENINMSMETGGGKFRFLVSENGNTIQITSKISISKMQFPPEEYQVIKHYFDLIVEKHGEQIVLKKI